MIQTILILNDISNEVIDDIESDLDKLLYKIILDTDNINYNEIKCFMENIKLS